MRAESTLHSGLSCVRSQNWDKVRSILPWPFRLLRICLQHRRPWFCPWVRKIP